jgi:hypothetical protein
LVVVVVGGLETTDWEVEVVNVFIGVFDCPHAIPLKPIISTATAARQCAAPEKLFCLIVIVVLHSALEKSRLVENLFSNHTGAKRKNCGTFFN